ncbi:MAG TPA: hypothetical protein VFZ09_30800 [Archangium sp.]|uniref:hypothetical protein n=1 Tax=Archangium sp. TaxID=1872627 RepID=UPI002E30EFF6|nr:hypothetical protein [Archangium sp.]HEX5750656.1 hypothetical protein [Archangium sp.]
MSSPPASRWLRWLNGLLQLLIFLLLALCVATLASYLLHPEEYRFGTEVGGLRYRSSLHYSGLLLLEALLLCCGLVLTFVTRTPIRRMWLALGVVLLDGVVFVGLLHGGGH